MATFGRAAEARGDPRRRLAVPIGAGQQIEARLRTVHRAKIGETVGPEIGRLIDPIALAEIRHLHNHRLAREIKNAETIDEVLAGAGDVALLPADIVVQHGDMIDRRDGSDAANEDRAPDSLERDVAVEHVDQGPRPEIGEAGDLTHIIGSEPCARGRPARKAQGAPVSILHRSDRLCSRRRSGDDGSRAWHEPQSMQQLDLGHGALPRRVGAKSLAQSPR